MTHTAEKHPMRVLEHEAPIPPNDLTLILAQHGVGKTAVLINFGLDRLLQQKTVRHFTSSMTTEKTLAYYQEIYADFSQHYFEISLPAWDEIKPNLTVVSYPSNDDMVRAIGAELKTISDQTQTQSELVLVDDLDYFEGAPKQVSHLAKIASQNGYPIVAGVTVHRDHSGTVPLSDPYEAMSEAAAAFYYMEPDPHHDRVIFDVIESGKAEQLSIFFDPHKLIFRTA